MKVFTVIMLVAAVALSRRRAGCLAGARRRRRGHAALRGSRDAHGGARSRRAGDGTLIRPAESRSQGRSEQGHAPRRGMYCLVICLAVAVAYVRLVPTVSLEHVPAGLCVLRQWEGSSRGAGTGRAGRAGLELPVPDAVPDGEFQRH